MIRSLLRAVMASGMLLLALVSVSPEPASAADAGLYTSVQPRSGPSRAVLPFARSERAQSVWAGGACRTECGSYCAWGQTACLSRDGLGPDAQAQCLKLTDACDRSCQRSCRSSGGPYLPLDF